MRHGRIVQRCTRRILGTADHIEQGIKTSSQVVDRGRGLIDRRILGRSDEDVEVRCHGDAGDEQAERREAPRVAQHGVRGRSGETEPAEHDQPGASQTQTDEQRPDSSDYCELSPFPSSLERVRGWRATQRRGQEHDDRGTGQERQQVVADGNPGQIHDQEQNPGRAIGSPLPAPDVK